MWTKKFISVGLALVGTLALIECSDTKPMSTAPGRAAANSALVRPTPAPAFLGRSIDNVATRDILAHARTLRFDATSPAGDRITAHSPSGEVVHLQVDPEVGAAALADADVEAGRIIARVTSSAPYAPLGLAAGTSYFWVDGAGEHARAVMIPEDVRAGRTVRPLLLRRHAAKSEFTTARFVNVDYNGGVIPLINTRCSSWCCSFTSPFDASALPLIDAALLDMHRRVDAISR
jgi:hypothetical protein